MPRKNELKFLTDKMYLRLTRRLRMMGFDTAFNEDYVDYNFIKIALDENRILITRDEDLKQRAIKKEVNAITIAGETIEDRLADLSLKTSIPLDITELQESRCSICNSKMNTVDKEEIKDKVGNGTYEKYNTFWRCINNECNKIYWKGSHWDKLEKSLIKAQKIAEKQSQKK